MEEIEIEGRTVTMAVESGLKRLGLRRDQVEVQVLEEGNAGFLGLGSKLARVRLRRKLWGESPMTPEEEEDDNRGNRIVPESPKPSRRSPQEYRNRSQRPPRAASTRLAADARPPRPRAPEPKRAPQEEIPVDTQKACDTAVEILREILSLAGLSDAAVKCAWDAEQSRVKAEVETADAEILIGRMGKTLESLQFIATIIVGRKLGVPVAVQVETQNYWRKIEEKVLSEVERAVSEVKKTGRPYRFDPMEPSLRRLVHRTLAGSPDVETASEGEGAWRKVVLRPRAK